MIYKEQYGQWIVDPLTIPVPCDGSYKHILHILVPRKSPDQLPFICVPSYHLHNPVTSLLLIHQCRRNHVYKYFAQVLSTREEPKLLLISNTSEHRAMCAFILTSIACGMPEGQRVLFKEGVGKLEENEFLLRQWIVLCIAQIWAKNDENRAMAVG